MHRKNDDFKLLYGKKARYCIYQLRDSKKVPLCAESIEKVDYMPVHTAKISTLGCSETAKEHEILEYIFVKFNQKNLPEYEGRPLYNGDIIALKVDAAVPKAFYIDRLNFIELPGFFDEALGIKEETELAVKLSGIYIGIQECTDGYDYTIYDEHYKELDGGIYDNPDISIWEALEEIISDVKMHPQDYLVSVDEMDAEITEIEYEELMEKAEEVALAAAPPRMKGR